MEWGRGAEETARIYTRRTPGADGKTRGGPEKDRQHRIFTSSRSLATLALNFRTDATCTGAAPLEPGLWNTTVRSLTSLIDDLHIARHGCSAILILGTRTTARHDTCVQKGEDPDPSEVPEDTWNLELGPAAALLADSRETKPPGFVSDSNPPGPGPRTVLLVGWGVESELICRARHARTL